jgi:hypothetical protein
VEWLASGGTLVVVSLSEVGHGPGDFRIRPGELLDAFGSLKMLDHAESEGFGRNPGGGSLRAGPALR